MPLLSVLLVITIQEKAHALDEFLNSLMKQTCYPQEVIIVGENLTTSAWASIHKIKKELPVKLKAIPSSMAGFQCINGVIGRTNHSTIAIADADCILDSQWLHKITAPFEMSEVDMVLGRYIPDAENSWQRCVAGLTVAQTPYLNKFNPSKYSLALSREAWKNIGGFSKLPWCEEGAYLDLALGRKGSVFALAPDAIVFCKQPKNILGVCKQVYRNAKAAGLRFYNKKVYLKSIIRCLICTALLIITLIKSYYWLIAVLFLLVMIATIKGAKQKIPYFSWEVWCWAPWVTPVVEASRAIGYFWGVVCRFTSGGKN